MAHPNFRRLIGLVTLLALLTAAYWAWQRYHVLLPSAPSQKTTVLNIDWQHVRIDEVRVYKAKRQVQVLQKGTVIKTYAMRLGFAPIGHKTTGGDVMIHGSSNLPQGKPQQAMYDYLPREDWTHGCVSVSNQDMDELWAHVKNGTKIVIYP